MNRINSIFSSSDEDMRDYYKKIWSHRAKAAGKYVIGVLLLVLLIAGIRYYNHNRSFTKYTVLSAVERQDAVTTRYAHFGKNILKYGRDGISYTDEKNQLLFSAAYTMQDPVLALNEKTGVVADRGGNQLYIFDQTQLQGQVTTKLPIKKAVISNQGIVAVLLEETNAVQFQIYLKTGENIGEGSFSLEDTGYPMNLSISSDGTKVAISFAQIDGSTINSCVAVYNFDKVGENYVDHLVFTKEYKNKVVPEVHYFDHQKFVTVGDDVLTCYEGTQIPEVTREITIEDEIRSVFYGRNRIAFVFEREEGNALVIYSSSGDKVAEIVFDLKYDNIYLEENNVIIYNDTEMSVYNLGGKECYRGAFETPVEEVFPTSARNKYILIYNNETQLIQLQ